MNYIGTDIHISTLDFQVVNNFGKVKMARKVKTSAPNFLDSIKSVPKPCQIIIEEGPLAANSPHFSSETSCSNFSGVAVGS
jgi:hypothetical protein